MGADDVFPAEMPNHPSSPIPALDNDTAERLLSGRLDPDDAPPAYAGVARLLQIAGAPPHPDELTGQEAALTMFRATWVGPGGVEGGSGRVRGGSGPRRRAGRVRGRLVAVALAGVLVGGAVAGGAATGGLWTTDGGPSSGRLRSPTGGAGAGAAGSGAPGVGVGSGAGPGGVSGSGGSGLRRSAGSAAVTDGERAVARHGGGGGSRGGGAAHGAKPRRHPEAKASEAEASEAEAGKAGKPKAERPAPKGPTTTHGHGANSDGGKRK
jgi:hypothetical protein